MSKEILENVLKIKKKIKPEVRDAVTKILKKHAKKDGLNCKEVAIAFVDSLIDVAAAFNISLITQTAPKELHRLLIEESTNKFEKLQHLFLEASWRKIHG